MRKKKRTFAETSTISLNPVTVVPFLNREELRRAEASLTTRQMTAEEYRRHFGGGDDIA